MSKFSRGLQSLRLLLIFLVTASVLTGCGSSRGEFVYPVVPGQDLNTLMVNLEVSEAVNGRISAAAREFEISLYDVNKTFLAERVLAPNQSATFTELADGQYWVRVLALDAAGQTVGYFDRQVVLPGDSPLTIRALIYTDTVPPLGSQADPFLAFEQFPETVLPGVPFAVRISAYNANGTPFTSAAGSVDLTSTGASFLNSPAPVALSNGSADFTELVFTADSVGPAVLTATSAVFSSAISPEILVGAEPIGSSLVFSATPEFVVAGEVFPSVVTVEARGSNGELVSEPVEVTLSLTSAAELAELGGTVAVATVDGVATFDDLTVSGAEEFALIASAPGFEPDTSALIFVEAPYRYVVVGDYFTHRFLTYDLLTLQPGNNDIAPLFEYSGADTRYNWSLAPVGDSSVWHYDGEDSYVHLFKGVMANVDDATPALTLSVGENSWVEDIAYDERRDVLYVAFGIYTEGEGEAYELAVFEKATELSNNALPTRTISGFSGFISALVVDARGDTLFVISSGADDVESDSWGWKYYVFSNASSLEDGDLSSTEHRVVDFESNNSFFGGSYDYKNDRLWLSGYGDSVVNIIDNASDPASPLVIRELREAEDEDEGSPSYWTTFYDTVTDRLFVTDYSGERILIYEKASELDELVNIKTPDITISGAATGLEEPDGIVLFR